MITADDIIQEEKNNSKKVNENKKIGKNSRKLVHFDVGVRHTLPVLCVCVSVCECIALWLEKQIEQTNKLKKSARRRRRNGKCMRVASRLFAVKTRSVSEQIRKLL